MIIILPLLTFNFEEGAVSEIENKVLAENPFKIDYSDPDESFHGNLDAYLIDRLGLKSELVYAYSVFNDKMFGKMEHPLYSYGEDGYVFGAGLSTDEVYTDFHDDFADMVLQLQIYCEDRDIPFVFVFEPAKPAVITEYIPVGVNYNRDWVDEFFEVIDENNINYVNNTDMLRDKMHSGEMVFNKVYDAGHWNPLGAFYGVNAVLEKLHEDFPSVHINSMDEMNVGVTKATRLPVSNFPIDEDVPVIFPKKELDSSLTDMYVDEIEIDEEYPEFDYYVNDERKEEGAPKALVFQGSYMNEYGYPFFANSFSEYIIVQDYQNIMNIDYYYNIFKPDCIVFEVAEYTFNNNYFDQETMANMKLNKPFNVVLDNATVREELIVSKDELLIEEGNTLTKITFNTEETFDSVWLLSDSEYDMRKSDGGYEVTIPTDLYKNFTGDFRIECLKGNTMTGYVCR